MTEPPVPPPPPGPDFGTFERRCPKCRQLVGEDFWCPECSSSRPTFIFCALLILVTALAANSSQVLLSATAAKAASLLGLSGVGLYGLYALLSHQSKWRALVRENPALIAARADEKQARLAQRSWLTAPSESPLAGPPCPVCRSVLDGQGWCFKCAKRRQNQMLIGISIGGMALGAGACSLGFVPSPGPLASVLPYLGQCLFVGVPLACFLVSARKPRRPKRSSDE